MPEPIEVRKVAIKHVSDASGLTELIDAGVVDADRVIAVIGKTEGNGGINDYTRIIADRAFREVLVDRGTRTMEQAKEVPIVWSGGTDGVISPHATIFATLPPERAEQTDEPRVTVGYAMSEQLLPEEIGRRGMIEKVADAVRVAMHRAGITDPAGLPLIGVLFSVYFFLLTPVTNSIVRTNEAEADRFGIAVSGQADGFAFVAMQLSEYRKISPGYWEEILFYDHPSGANRVRAAMEWKAEHQPPP